MPPYCTLRDIRRGSMPKVGYYLARTVTTGSISSLTDTKYPVRSGNIQDDLFQGKYLLRPDALDIDKVRVVAENGYLSTSGTLQPDLDWDQAPSPGEVYEISGGGDPWEEFNDVVNTALKRCYLVTEIALAATAGATRHGLNVAAPWLQSAADVRQFGYLNSGESRNAYNPYINELVAEPVDDEGGVYLDHWPMQFNNAEVLYCRALKPVWSSCRATTAGTFGDREGLAADAHEAPVALDWAVSAVMVEYWERYANQLPEGDPEGNAAGERQMRWASIYDTLRSRYLRVPSNNMKPRPVMTGLASRH